MEKIKISLIVLFCPCFLFSQKVKPINSKSKFVQIQCDTLINLMGNSGSFIENTIHSKDSFTNIFLNSGKNYHCLYLEFSNDGNLMFDIKPAASHIDLDFMIFEYSEKLETLNKHLQTLSPIRANFANNELTKNGYTGIKSIANVFFVKKGIGNPYSQSLKIAKKQKIILIINDVKDSKIEYSVQFNFIKSNTEVVQIKKEPIISSKKPGRLPFKTIKIKLDDTPLNKVFIATNGFQYALNCNYPSVFKYKGQGVFQLKLLTDMVCANYIIAWKENTFLKDTVFEYKNIDKIDSFNFELKPLLKGDKYLFKTIFVDANGGLPECDEPILMALKNVFILNRNLKVKLRAYVGYSEKNEKISSKEELVKTANYIKKYLCNSNLFGEKINQDRLIIETNSSNSIPSIKLFQTLESKIHFEFEIIDF